MSKVSTRVHAGRTPACRIGQRDDALLDTARQLFLARGFAQVSIELIARTAGVAARTIYVHFGDKHGLLDRVIEREQEREAISANTLLAGAPGVKELLCDVAFNLLKLSFSTETGYLHADALAVREHLVARRIDPVRCRPWRAALEACFASPEWSARQGASVDVTILCDMFIGCVMGAQLRALDANEDRALDGHELQMLAHQITQNFLAGCGKIRG